VYCGNGAKEKALKQGAAIEISKKAHGEEKKGLIRQQILEYLKG